MLRAMSVERVYIARFGSDDRANSIVRANIKPCPHNQIFRCPGRLSSSEIRRARDGSALDRAGRVVCSLCLAGLCRAGQRFAFSARCSDGCSDDLIFSCPIHQPLILNARPDIATVPQLVVTFAAISVAFERWLRSKILNTRITAKTSAMPLIESNLCSW